MLDFWKQTVESAKEEFSDHVFNTWIKPLQYKTTKKDEVCVEVPNNLYKEKIKKFYYPFLVEKYRAISNNGTMDICFELSSSQKKKPQPEITLVKKEKKPIESSTFLPHYTFETFVVGNNNHLAFAASEGICEEPGRKFNPLLLYGGVGLGKTHLLHAIGNYFTKKDASLSIVYKTSEEFMNDLVHGIRFEKMDVFRNRYRHCDVLLIDDIQFFSGKERTQEEFFHTFNVLFQENKQIVVTSDRLPSEIPDLDNRLRSRFQSGLFCDIQTPDLETRIAILKRKADQEKIELSDEISYLLAKNIASNVRILEGALIRLSAVASLKKSPITNVLAQEVLSSLSIEEKKVSVDQILKTVAVFYHLSVGELKSSRRKKNIAQPRQIAMYLARKHTDLSFPELGDRFGGKDHTTIMHGVSKVQNELKINENLQNTISAIEKNILHQ